jgi:hypothetical protein
MDLRDGQSTPSSKHVKDGRLNHALPEPGRGMATRVSIVQERELTLPIEQLAQREGAVLVRECPG